MESFAFQAEINQLLSLIINAFYSNKDVFLRELISNAIDALDKVRYQTLAKGNAASEAETGELYVRVSGDKDAMRLVVEDTGVGMSQEELIKNLGTIAHSGTKTFIEALKSGNADVSLIGQFGVGFYSAFLVADTVEVYSRTSETSDLYKWQSNAGGSFHVGKVLPEDGDEFAKDLKRGTRIVMRLKEGMGEYAEEHKIREIVRQHSEYSTFPIYMRVKRTREEEVPEDTDVSKEENPNSSPDDAVAAIDADASDIKDAEEEIKGEDGEIEEITDSDTKKEEEEKPKQMRTVEYYEDDHLNKIRPLWMRKPEEVTEEEHSALFKSLSTDWEPPLGVKHFEVDGNVQFRAVLYCPKNSPVELFQQKKKKNIKLYVKKVFVTDDADQLVPDYLNFVHGIVDSDDLPLNVSREMLQQNKIMGNIKKNLVKKCIEMFKEISDNPDKYVQFYKKFSKNIKLAVHDDSTNRDKFTDLLRFHTTKTIPQVGTSASTDDAMKNMSSLQDYISRMKEGQESIYFITADSVDSARNSPCIEKLTKLGYEVILMVDPMDEYLMQVLHEYKEKRFACCSRVGLKVPGEETPEDLDKHHEKLIKVIKECLGEKVHRVQMSNRLVQSPCVMVTDSYGWTANMERIVKAQALRDSDDVMSQYMVGKRIFEINAESDIVKNIQVRIDKDCKDSIADSVRSLIHMIYKTALISSGFSLDDPINYAHKVFSMIRVGMTGDDEDIEDLSMQKGDTETDEASNGQEESIMEQVD